MPSAAPASLRGGAATAAPATRPRSTRRPSGARSERPSGPWLMPAPGARRPRPPLSGDPCRAPSRQTLEQAAKDWLKAANAGVIRTRSGDPYKPGALRGYEQALSARLVPRFGHLKTSALHRNAVQDLVDEMLAEGLAPSTVRNAILPLRAIYRRLLSRSEVSVNPTLGLSLPAIRDSRDRVARPGEARALLEALSPSRSPALGDGALRRPAPRRAARPALVRCRLRGGPDPRRARLGPKGGADRTEEPRRQAPGAPGKAASLLPRRPSPALAEAPPRIWSSGAAAASRLPPMR